MLWIYTQYVERMALLIVRKPNFFPLKTNYFICWFFYWWSEPWSRIVHPRSARCPSLTFHIFNFSLETAEWNLTKLDSKQVLNALYHVYVLGPIGKQRWLLWPLIGWDILTFRQLLNGIWRNLTGSKYSTSSTKFVFFGSIGKQRWPSWLLNGWDIFDFSSVNAEWSLTKPDRKKVLIILYHFGIIFLADTSTSR